MNGVFLPFSPPFLKNTSNGKLIAYVMNTFSVIKHLLFQVSLPKYYQTASYRLYPESKTAANKQPVPRYRGQAGSSETQPSFYSHFRSPLLSGYHEIKPHFKMTWRITWLIFLQYSQRSKKKKKKSRLTCN